MSDTPLSDSPLGHVLAELKARHVLQTAVIYVLVGLGLIEFVDIVFGAYGLPESGERLVIGIVLAGFPAAIAAAWFLEWNGGRVRVRSSRSGLPRLLVACGAALVILGPLGGAVAINLRSARDAALPENATAASTDTGEALVIEVFEPTAWASDTPAVLSIEEGTSAMMHGAARYHAGIDRVLLDGQAEGQRRLSVGLSDSARFASFTGFVDADDEDGRIEIVVLGADGRYASRSFSLVKRSGATGAATPVERYDQRRAAALARATDGRVTEGNRWAVVIGIGDYASEVIPDLSFAARDASAFYQFLLSPAAGGGGIPPENMMLLLDDRATARNIRSGLSTFLRAAAPEDEVLVFIVAHGAPDPFNPDELYLLTHDTELDDMAATAVAMADVREMISEAYGYTKFVIADITHSAGVGGAGQAMSNGVNDALLNTVGTRSGGFIAFTASESHQLSLEGEQYGGGHGVFTYYLLESLQGAADEDGDGVVSLGEVVAYTRERVRRNTRNAQIPSFSNTTYDNHWPIAVVLDR